MLNKKVKTFEDIKSPVLNHEGKNYKKYQGYYWDEKLEPFEKPGTPLDMDKVKKEREALEAKGKIQNQEANYKKENEELKRENTQLKADLLEALEVKKGKESDKKK